LTWYKTHNSGCWNLAKIFFKVFLFALAFFVGCLTSDFSYAFNEADLARLLSTKQCQWCNLQDADLSGTQLSGAQLSNASLTSARLTNTNLSRTNLSGAFLMKANLTGAKLIDAFLVNANLSNANLTDADFSGADLSGAIWTDGTKCEKKSFGECKQSNLLGEPK
jgi:uncharacterized protein YjbI with pentapeptide repeats